MELIIRNKGHLIFSPSELLLIFLVLKTPDALSEPAKLQQAELHCQQEFKEAKEE